MRASLPALTALALLLGGCPHGDRTNPCEGALSGCLDSARAFTCIKGVYREIYCGDEHACDEGECKRRVCDPALFFCDGQNAVVCNPSGTEEVHTNCGTENAQCVVGPLTASCVVQSCPASQTYCAPDGSEVRKCALDGLSFDVVQRCDDPQQRGNHCAGSACRDRCALLEAQDRSTLGCRFVTASRSTATQLLFANPQPDLPATVTVRAETGAPTTRTIAAGGFLQLPWAPSPATGTSVAARAIYVTSTVPVYVALGASDGLAVHPEHALSTDSLVALDGSAQTLAIVASQNGTLVQVAVTSAIAAGGAIPATPAGGTVAQTLQRGQVLTLFAGGALSGSRISASAPVAVLAASSAGATSLPGAETLGLELALMQPGLVVARDAATRVTTDRDGIFTLGAGASHAVAGDQRIHASAPLLALASSGAGIEVVPPIAQWRSEHFPVWSSGGTPSLLAASEQAQSLSWANGAKQALVLVSTFAWSTFAGTTPMGLTGSQPFYLLVTGAGDLLPSAYGLAQIQ